MPVCNKFHMLGNKSQRFVSKDVGCFHKCGGNPLDGTRICPGSTLHGCTK